MADSDEDTVEETKETVKKMFDQIYNLLLKDKSKEVDSSAEFWDAIKTLDWMGAVSLASNNIQTIQEYALLVLKVVFYNFTLFLSTLSGKVLKFKIFDDKFILLTDTGENIQKWTRYFLLFFPTRPSD